MNKNNYPIYRLLHKTYITSLILGFCLIFSASCSRKAQVQRNTGALKVAQAMPGERTSAGQQHTLAQAEVEEQIAPVVPREEQERPENVKVQKPEALTPEKSSPWGISLRGMRTERHSFEEIREAYSIPGFVKNKKSQTDGVGKGLNTLGAVFALAAVALIILIITGALPNVSIYLLILGVVILGAAAMFLFMSSIGYEQETR